MSDIRRNDPCPCGSGRRYKQCCGRLESAAAAGAVGSDPFQAALQLHQAGRLDEAEKLYRDVLRERPGHAEARHFLGLLAYQSGRGTVAEEHIRKAIATSPSAQMHTNLGVVLQSLGKLAEAENCYSSAIADEPGFVDAHYNLGLLLNVRGRFDEAVRSFQRVLALQPAHADAHAHLGDALGSLGDLDGAIASYRAAIRLNPRFAGAHNNLALLLRAHSRPEEAEAGFRDAIEADPGFAEAHVNLGLMLSARGRRQEAAQSFRKALALDPGNASAYSNLLFLEGYAAGLAPKDYVELARGWERACVPERLRLAATRKTFPRKPLAGRRLKVGYVSGDFCDHAVSHFIRNVIANHDATRVEIGCYYTDTKHDSVTGEFIELSDRWVSLAGLDDSTAADRITADEVDVLVDLSGHTNHGRLGVFALRAAPVQCHYLGFVSSTGLTEMDYWIGDDIVTPPGTDGFFTERVWRLPRVWVSYEGRPVAPPPRWNPDRDGTAWLGSFNALQKLTPETLALWARILASLPEGRLLLKTAELADRRNRQRLLEAFTGHGISADRIELLDRSATRDWPSHMALYDRVDIALDPVGGVGGGTTTCDALWMSVPVVTLVGDRMASRMTASMLEAIGHGEWIARTEDEYVKRVVDLARDRSRLGVLRSTLRDRMRASPLCDSPGLARHLEDAYVGMYEEWLALAAGGSVGGGV